jgi:signal transduction histidine kinase
MHDVTDQSEHVAPGGSSGETAASPQPTTWSLTGTDEARRLANFEAALLAIAAHDLRQPIQVIQGAHERLGIGVRTESELRLLQLGKYGIDRMTEQLDQLLGALLLHEQGEEMTLSPVAVEPLLRQACCASEEIAARKGIRIRMVPTTAFAMSHDLLLSAILRNLVSNAIKYTRPGGRVLLGCRHVGRSVRIDVLDTGIGIADEQLPRIFEAFTRLDSTRRDGLGIGLFIVRKAIGILGHRIDVRSTVGRGSRFSIFATRAGRVVRIQSGRTGQNHG